MLRGKLNLNYLAYRGLGIIGGRLLQQSSYLAFLIILLLVQANTQGTHEGHIDPWCDSKRICLLASKEVTGSEHVSVNPTQYLASAGVDDVSLRRHPVTLHLEGLGLASAGGHESCGCFRTDN